MSSVSDLLAEILQLGDPPVTVSIGKMSLDVRRKNASTVAREVISSHIARCWISGELDAPPGTCVLSSVSDRVSMLDR